MPTVEENYWASVTRPNTTFDPVYQIDLAVGDKTLKFKGKGVSVKQDEKVLSLSLKEKLLGRMGLKILCRD